MQNSKYKLEVITPFGPAIAKTKIPDDIIDKLNGYFEKTISNEHDSLRQDHGQHLVGNVTKEIKIDHEYVEESKWLNFLSQATQAYVHFVTGKKNEKFSLIESWIVSQFSHEYNPTHWHGGHLSGAGYLKVPDTLGESFQKKRAYNHNGHLQLIHGTRQFLSHSLYTIKPQVGDFYIFPHYLMHTVFPFSGTDKERRCVSFNARIDESVYNIY